MGWLNKFAKVRFEIPRNCWESC